MAHYLIINTGGTIGMTDTKSGLAPKPGTISQAFNTHPDLQPWQAHELTWVEWNPLLDSSELQPEHWFQIRADILAQDKVDGCLVVHGTDTLSYTAAALSFLMSDRQLPIVITGSMLPIGAKNSDAIENLVQSLNALAQARPEVVVAIGEQTMPASRVTKASTERMNSFETPNWDTALWSAELKSSPLTVSKPYSPQSVAVLTLFPGFNESNLPVLSSNGPSAVLFNAFGNGNAANTPAMNNFLGKARDLNIPVFVRSQCAEGQVNFGQYAASELFQRYGAISCGGMAFEAALCKITILLSQLNTTDEVVATFQQPVAREWQNL